MDVAVILQRVPGLAEVLRGVKSGFEAAARRVQITLHQGLPAKRQMRSNVLSKGQAFSSFPGLKTTRSQQRARIFIASGEVVQRRQFHGKIIAPQYKGPVGLQFPEPFLRRDGHPFPELVAFV